MERELLSAPIFQGRLGVVDFWKSTIALSVFSLALGALLFLCLPIPYGFVFAFLPVLVVVPFQLGLIVRRVHDFGMRGTHFFVLLFGISVVGSFFLWSLSEVIEGKAVDQFGIALDILLKIFFILLLSRTGTRGTNQFGEHSRYKSITAAVLSTRNESTKPRNVFLHPVFLLLIVLGVVAAATSPFSPVRDSISDVLAPFSLMKGTYGLNGVTILLPEHLEIRMRVKAHKDGFGSGSTNYEATSETITLPDGRSQSWTLDLRTNATKVGVEGNTVWYLVQFNVEDLLAEEGYLTYIGLFSRTGNATAVYHDAILVGNFVAISAWRIESTDKNFDGTLYDNPPIAMQFVENVLVTKYFGGSSNSSPVKNRQYKYPPLMPQGPTHSWAVRYQREGNTLREIEREPYPNY